MKEFKKIPNEETMVEEAIIEDIHDEPATDNKTQEEAETDTEETPQYKTLLEALDENTEPYPEAELVEEVTTVAEAQQIEDEISTGAWAMFNDKIHTLKKGNNISKGRICHIETSIAKALDECAIDGASRDIKINAILMTFIKTHLKELKECRKSYIDIIASEK